jgi:hypothetical protein
MKLLAISLFLVAVAALPVFPGEGDNPSPSPSPSCVPSDSSALVTPTPLFRAQEVSGGFVRYIPNREGDYEWKMEGEKGTFLSPVCLEITLFTATALAPRLGDLTIAADTVLYFTNSGIIRSGASRITVRRENMLLTGKGYIWTPHNEQIRVFEDVRLLIKEGADGGLFPF